MARTKYSYTEVLGSLVFLDWEIENFCLDWHPGRQKPDSVDSLIGDWIKEQSEWLSEDGKELVFTGLSRMAGVGVGGKYYDLIGLVEDRKNLFRHAIASGDWTPEVLPCLGSDWRNLPLRKGMSAAEFGGVYESWVIDDGCLPRMWPRIDEYGGSGYTLLGLAIRLCRNVDCVDFLLSHGASVSALDGHDWTPLCHAIEACDSLDVLEFLLQRGSDVGGLELFLWSERSARPEVLSMLLEKCEHIDAWRDCDGRTLLHRVASSSLSDDSLDQLIAAGANVNAVDYRGNTPLHYTSECASWSGVKLQKVKKLLSAGAKAGLQNESGDTPADLAGLCRETKAIFRYQLEMESRLEMKKRFPGY